MGESIERGDPVNIFEVFHRPEFVDIAPKSMKDLKEFAYACHNTDGFHELGDWVEEWILHMEYFKIREWDVGEATTNAAESD